MRKTYTKPTITIYHIEPVILMHSSGNDPHAGKHDGVHDNGKGPNKDDYRHPIWNP